MSTTKTRNPENASTSAPQPSENRRAITALGSRIDISHDGKVIEPLSGVVWDGRKGKPILASREFFDTIVVIKAAMRVANGSDSQASEPNEQQSVKV